MFSRTYWPRYISTWAVTQGVSADAGHTMWSDPPRHTHHVTPHDTNIQSSSTAHLLRYTGVQLLQNGRETQNKRRTIDLVARLAPHERICTPTPTTL